jgi:hypothetical protein
MRVGQDGQPGMAGGHRQCGACMRLPATYGQGKQNPITPGWERGELMRRPEGVAERLGGKRRGESKAKRRYAGPSCHVRVHLFPLLVASCSTRSSVRLEHAF